MRHSRWRKRVKPLRQAAVCEPLELRRLLNAPGTNFMLVFDDEYLGRFVVVLFAGLDADFVATLAAVGAAAFRFRPACFARTRRIQGRWSPERCPGLRNGI